MVPKTSDVADNAAVSHDVILNALADSIIALDSEGRISYINNATELLFSSSAKILVGQKLHQFISFDSPLLALIDSSRNTKAVMSEYDVEIGHPRVADKKLDIHVTPIIDHDNSIIIQIQERGIAQKFTQQLSHRSAARSVSGMAAVLAHEIKNPLSGIRGSAQLLEENASEEERELTELICEETDRIRTLVDKMEIFSDQKPIEPQNVNIHSVLDHVHKLAMNGFGRNVRFIQKYDPSIPDTRGDKGQLIQVFLNLIKNAVEAAPKVGGQVVITTSYKNAVRLAIPGSNTKQHLPLEICIIDNGAGVAEDLRSHLFDPFVTTKSYGTGLGLALVAKIVGEHGGIIEYSSEPGKTVFRVLLPKYEQDQDDRS